MVDVEVVVDVVEVCARQLVLGGIVPAGERGDWRLAAEFVADKGAEAVGQAGFHVREENRECGGMAAGWCGAVAGVERLLSKIDGSRASR